jgi:hypothetical protein
VNPASSRRIQRAHAAASASISGSHKSYEICRLIKSEWLEKPNHITARKINFGQDAAGGRVTLGKELDPGYFDISLHGGSAMRFLACSN